MSPLMRIETLCSGECKEPTHGSPCYNFKMSPGDPQMSPVPEPQRPLSRQHARSQRSTDRLVKIFSALGIQEVLPGRSHTYPLGERALSTYYIPPARASLIRMEAPSLLGAYVQQEINMRWNCMEVAGKVTLKCHAGVLGLTGRQKLNEWLGWIKHEQRLDHTGHAIQKLSQKAASLNYHSSLVSLPPPFSPSTSPCSPG